MLRSRHRRAKTHVQRRHGGRRHELQLSDQYSYQVVNDTVPQAVDEICEILRSRGLEPEA